MVQLLLSLIIVFNNLDYLRDVNENTDTEIQIQAKSGQVKLGQDKSGQVKSEQIK